MYSDDYYDTDYENRGGRGNACCLTIFTLITMIMCLCCWQTVSYYMDASFCYWVYSCCNAFCTIGCRQWICSGGQWYTTRPSTQDMLPPPMNVSNGQENFLPAGNGEWDYWSIGVVGIAGPISSVFVMFASCGMSASRSPPASCAGFLLLLGGLMKIACTVCLGIQFSSVYSEGQVVFNYFQQDNQYVTIYTSLLTYLNGNQYMSGWGGTITATYTFLIISAMYETLYGLIVFCCNDDKYSGVQEWETENVTYRRKPVKGKPKNGSRTRCTVHNVQQASMAPPVSGEYVEDAGVSANGVEIGRA